MNEWIKFQYTFKNCGAFAFWMSKTLLSRCSRRFRYFCDFDFFYDLCGLKSVLVTFRVHHENLTLEHASHHPNPIFKFWHLTSWPRLTLTRRYHILRRVLEISQTRSKQFHRLSFNLIRLWLPKLSMVVKILTYDRTCDVINDLQIKLSNIFGGFMPGTMKCRFRIEDRPSNLANSRGPTPSPSQGGNVCSMYILWITQRSVG